MIDSRPEDPWKLRLEDCGMDSLKPYRPSEPYRPCGVTEQLEVRQTAAGREHRYRLLGFKAHATQRGAETELPIWEGTCADCGQAFELVSARKVPRYLLRRCPECRHARWLRYPGGIDPRGRRGPAG